MVSDKNRHGSYERVLPVLQYLVRTGTGSTFDESYSKACIFARLLVDEEVRTHGGDPSNPLQPLRKGAVHRTRCCLRAWDLLGDGGRA